MSFLRQSTSQVIRFGPCLDKTDGVTEETALTLAQADMRLSKDGGAYAQKSAAGSATHDSDGHYSTTLSTTDTDTVGELRLNIHQPANMLPVWDRWWVIEEAIYDALFGAAAAGFDSNQRVDVGSWLGTAAATPTVAGVPEVDITHQGGGAIPAPAVTGVPDVNITHHVDVAASVSGGNLDVNVETEDNIDFGATKKASINAEADTALTDYDAPTKAEMDTGHGLLATEAKQDIIDTNVDDIETDLANATDGLGALKTLIDAIQTDLDNGTDGLGALKTLIDTIDDFLDTEIAAIVAAVITNAAGADVAADIIALKAETVLIVADTNELQTDDVPGLISALNDPTVGAIADAVWDEAKSGHVAAGSFGEEVQAHALSSEITALNDLSAAEVNTEILDVMNTDTFAEPGQGAPPATASFFTKFNHIYKNWRNKKEEDSTEFRLFNDAGTVVDAKATVSDASGTTTKEEMVSGP